MDNIITITEEVAEQLFSFQPRCIECGGTYGLQIHHRIFRGEGELFLKDWLNKKEIIYSECYERKLIRWHLHDIQNLCVLCLQCHEGNITGVHNGNIKLDYKLKNSFTCPNTGFSIPFYKNKNLLW